MSNKLRLGFVGANVNSTWASQSHFPALLASPDIEFTAVCTTRPESAEEARQAFGAKLAFHDFKEMAASPEIDAVAVVVRVPSHYGPTKAAIEAGKHVFTEWPLGRNTTEAEELAALARDKGIQTAVGLQSRVSPALLFIKEQIEAGYVGEVLSCSVTTMRDGRLERHSSGTWQRDVDQGANTLTIANGHVIDALRFVAGDFSRVVLHGQHPSKAMVRDRHPSSSWRLPPRTTCGSAGSCGAARRRRSTSGPCPGQAAAFAWKSTVAKAHLSPRAASRPSAARCCGCKARREATGCRIWTYPGVSSMFPTDFPKGDPFNIGQMYALFAEAVRTGRNRAPTFDTAVDLHRFIDTLKQASDTGQELPVA